MIQTLELNSKENRCGDYEELYNIITTLITINPKEDILECIYDGSSFSRVKIDNRNYVVGLLKEDTLCFGIPVFSKNDRPYKLIGTSAVFIPAIKSNPNAFGYYMVFRTKDSFK